jgi:hypothetical protein
MRAARVLDWVGPFGPPMAVGIALGYWAAERGLPWLPTMVEGLLALLATSMLLIYLGLRLKRDHVVQTAQGVRFRKRILGVLAFSLVLGGGYVAKNRIEGPSRLTQLPPAEVDEAFELDLRRYRELSGGLDRAITGLERAGVFANERVLSADEERLVLDSWTAILGYTMALDQIRLFWEDWYRFDPGRIERPDMLRAFLLSFASELVLFENGGRLGGLVRGNQHARKFLDVPHPSHQLPEFSYSHFSQQLEGTKDQTRIVGGAQYLRAIDGVLGWKRDIHRLGLAGLWSDVHDRLDGVANLGLIDRTAMTLAGDAQALRRTIRRTWLPAQKGVAKLFGDTKLRRVGWYLITEEQQASIDTKLEPGDVLVTRKHWYLSNVGLPGWWPHGILYLGAPDKLVAWADDPVVVTWLAAQPGSHPTFEAYMEARFPRWWRTYQLGDGDHTYRLLEAHSPGVVLSSMEESSGDAMAALRPKLSKLAKVQAIAEAFEHLGKPYDFDFDFATDHALVCTEVIWRAYRPAEGKDGLDLPLIDVAGRKTLPANVMVERFVKDPAGSNFEFVLFVDADEEARVARFSDLEAFLETPERGGIGGG